MHAGDALWQLYGLSDVLHRHGQEKTAALLNERLNVIGAQLQVPAPGRDELIQLSSALENCVAPSGSAGYASEQQSAPKTNSAYANPELVAAASKLVDEMEASGQFDWADLVKSIGAQLNKDNAFITPKQCKALKNIAAGKDFGDEGTFWDWFDNEWGEHATVVADHANKAD